MKLFITGTNTHVGKTYVSVGLLQAAKEMNWRTIACKPLATGGTYNEDALSLRKASSIQLPYQLINPFSFEKAIAPHIAAKEKNILLSVKLLSQKINKLHADQADLYLFEGIGGWYVPLNNRETMADFIESQQLPVILIVGMQLGCLNHAILTVNAMKQAKIKIIGWIANCLDRTMIALDENINCLNNWLKVPFLGTISYQAKLEEFVLVLQEIIKFY